MSDMDCGIINEGNEKTSHTAFSFQNNDVPPSFRENYRMSVFSMAHPDDYVIEKEPIRPDLFLYKNGNRNRLFLRISIRLEENKFMAATFFLDSGCCSHMRLQGGVLHRIKSRLQKSDVSDDYMEIYGNLEHFTFVNVMGLPMFFLLGITFPQVKLTSLEYDHEDVCHYIGDIPFPYL